MTSTQFEDYGFQLNQWINMDNLCNGLLVSNEGHLYSEPKTMQIYLDSANELVWVRFTYGEPSLNEELKNNPEYVITKHNGKDYYVKLEDMGLVDSTVGRYHNVYDMNQITMIH